ncbi:MAG: hypothetical protein JWO36_5996 [Myxococcales bacterium]|nr:hypothetical protein [Myxococcales bacterium]
MSYLHCPTCSRAYNIAAQSSCPFCPVHATPVDPTEDIVVAAESLARAMTRATVAERNAAAARMDRLALPAPDADPVPFHGTMLRSIRNALDPLPSPEPRKPSLLTSVAMSLFARLAPHAPAPRMLGDGLRRAASGVRSRVKALASQYSL